MFYKSHTCEFLYPGRTLWKCSSLHAVLLFTVCQQQAGNLKRSSIFYLGIRFIQDLSFEHLWNLQSLLGAVINSVQNYELSFIALTKLYHGNFRYFCCRKSFVRDAYSYRVISDASFAEIFQFKDWIDILSLIQIIQSFVWWCHENICTI